MNEGSITTKQLGSYYISSKINVTGEALDAPNLTRNHFVLFKKTEYTCFIIKVNAFGKINRYLLMLLTNTTYIIYEFHLTSIPKLRTTIFRHYLIVPRSLFDVQIH